MTTTNQGNQEIIPDYHQDATSPKFMKRIEGLLPTGIYRGLEASRQGSDVIISSGIAEIKDDSDRQVRVHVNDPVTLTPTVNKPWILLTWEFNNQEDWWAEFLVAEDFLSNDIRLAKAEFDANGDLDSLDLSVRDYPKWAELDSQGNKVSEIRLVPNGNV